MKTKTVFPSKISSLLSSIEAQLDNPTGTIDRHLLEEACDELAKIYQSGVRDPEIVHTLAKLYHRFRRCNEYVDLLWDFAQTSSDASEVKEAFKAGYEAIFEMGQHCVADYERAIQSHQILLEKFKGRVTLAQQLDSYIHVSASYSRAGRHEAWLEQTERLAEQLGDEMPMAHRFFYMRTRAFTFRHLERYQEAIQTGEDFIGWIRTSEQLHPHKQRMIVEMQGLVLLPCYHKLGEQQKIETTLKDAQETLERYHAEREAVIGSITDEIQETRQRLNAAYQGIESFPIGIESYPAEASVAEIRDWLDRKYYTGLSYAMHNLAAGCTHIGEGETAIRLFKRVIEHDEKRGIHKANGNVNMWLASLMLSVRNDRNASLEHLKRAATDRRWAAAGWVKNRFETDSAFDSVRNDEEFLAVVNASVVI